MINLIVRIPGLFNRVTGNLQDIIWEGEDWTSFCAKAIEKSEFYGIEGYLGGVHSIIQRILDIMIVSDRAGYFEGFIPLYGGTSPKISFAFCSSSEGTKIEHLLRMINKE